MHIFISFFRPESLKNFLKTTYCDGFLFGSDEEIKEINY
jgi:hypothetical protein